MERACVCRYFFVRRKKNNQTLLISFSFQRPYSSALQVLLVVRIDTFLSIADTPSVKPYHAQNMAA
jgi:hypothetical protein